MKELAVGEYVSIAEGIYLEGLCVDHVRDVVWYSDVIAGGIHGVKPDGTKVAVLNPERMWTGGVMMNDDGAVLSSGQGGILWNHPDTGKSGWLLDAIDGEPLNGINEMWPDGTGGIFFGTLDIASIIAAKKTRPMALYRLTADREVIRLDAQVYFPNGMAFDAARSLFYCSDTFTRGWAWDIGPDLALSNQSVLLDRDDCDGLTLDAEGNVWITGVHSAGLIRRIAPDGALLAPVATPPGAATQVRFGGVDARDFYIAVVPADGGDSLKEGRPLTSPSYLYRGRAESPGVLVPPSRFRLD